MSEKAAGNKPDKGRAWQRNATRKAILSVARKMVERDGIELTSLNRVAEDAGFAPVTVYAYFPNKNDLLISLLAEDLAAMARRMRESFPFSEPEPERMKTEHAAPDAGGESAEVVSIPTAATPEMRKNSRSERIRAALKNDSLAESEAEKTEAPRVDAWLERRLRVFERTLGDLEARVAEGERNSVRAAALVQDGLAAFNQHMEAGRQRKTEETDALFQRMAELEKRQRDITAEFRSELKDVAGRVDALETSALGPAKPAIYLPPEETPVEEPQAVAPEAVQASESAPSGEPQKHEPRAAQESGETFLSAARRAANAAATLAQIEDDERGLTLTRRTRLMLVGGIALVAMVAGAALMFHNLPAKPATFAAITPAAAAQIGTGTTRIHPSLAFLHNRLEALASRGNAHAELLMGLDNLNGEGMTQNDVQGALWLGRAANAGDAVAQYWLAMLYQAGRGVNNDPATAIHWLEMSAMQGNRKAMHELAMAYALGKGVPQDYPEAARWFSRAADLGLVNSQFNLAVLYERGQGLPQSLLDAYKWYAIAAAQGDSEAQSRVDALATQLSPDDLAAARQAAANFKPQPLNAATNLVPHEADLRG